MMCVGRRMAGFHCGDILLDIRGVWLGSGCMNMNGNVVFGISQHVVHLTE